MKAEKTPQSASGFTLIEMLISLGIFGILMAFMYPTFSAIGNSANELGDKQALTQKGQRVINYVGEEIRLAGLFIGSNPSVNFCNEGAVNSINHINGDIASADPSIKNDSVTILTSERITTTEDNRPFLFTTLTGNIGDSTITVNVADAATVSAIAAAPGVTENARAFITFDTLKPNSFSGLVYQVTAFAGSTLTIAPALGQQVNMSSNAYSVIRKRVSVDATRNLQIQRWRADCTPDNQDLVSSYGPGNINGGVDGFEVEYTVWDNDQNATLTRSQIPSVEILPLPHTIGVDGVRAVTIYLLLRADFPSKDYIDTSTYTLGAVTVGPFTGDAAKYRRVLMTKTVEVKNVRL